MPTTAAPLTTATARRALELASIPGAELASTSVFCCDCGADNALGASHCIRCQAPAEDTFTPDDQSVLYCGDCLAAVRFGGSCPVCASQYGPAHYYVTGLDTWPATSYVLADEWPATHYVPKAV